ncbi:gliding motility protein GldL [Flavobacteriaceae bacterium]|jgi:gliding motility-associated protein GldL|nr:gliding motility protein GldL [Flavobacteriales bacterium]MDB2599427.1 gliding motility protein GldL [Flavobacteriaceae bacterium]
MALKLSKKTMNMAYGLGAAIVIIGALMKIIHKDLGPLSGNTLLSIGLITEALIFALSAFDTPEEDPDWALVYPELEGGSASASSKESPQGLLSKKLDGILKEAKIDASLVGSLSSSIKDMEASAKSGADSADSLAKVNKEFADNAEKLQKQMASLAANLESLNNVYGGVLGAMNNKK